MFAIDLRGHVMEVKGSVVATLPKFLQTRFGAEGYQRWLNALPQASRATFETPVMPVAWYPLPEALLQPTEAVCRIFYEGDLIGARECGRFSADEGLAGIYRFFVRWGSPGFIIQKAASILPTFYRPSAMEVARLDKKSAVLRTTEFAGSHDLVEARVAGWIEKALELSGCRGVHVGIPSSLARGESHTDYHLTWD